MVLYELLTIESQKKPNVFWATKYPLLEPHITSNKLVC